MERKRLSDILHNGQRDSISRAWGETQAADDFAPLPGGTYDCRVVSGELFSSKTGTPGYKLTFQVLEGEHAGRRVWDDLWLTPAALPMAKRDLAKLGITCLDQLERPLPEGIICRARVALRKADDGTEYNRLRSFEVLRVEPPTPDAFAPTEDIGTAEGAGNDLAGGDITFDPRQLEAEGGGA